MATQFIEYLRENKISVTKPRILVFDYLSVIHTPITIMELVEHFDGTIDRASIYRIVEVFENSGIVTRVYIGWKYKIELSETFHAHHHHMTCISCGSSINFEEEASFSAFLQRIGETHSFNITSHQLELRGICKSCA